MSQPITVTDHALVRYIERYHGLDLQPLRDDIEAAVRDAVAVKAAGVKLSNGCRIKLDGNVVCTVYPSGSKR